tara:strand:+ start:5223 stop:5585 length:363 start_codon:yes stop_codon:yes gene_type:complete
MENKSYEDREVVMLDVTKELWKNTRILAQIGGFKNVSELFNFSIALVCVLQTAAAFGCDEFFLKKKDSDDAYKININNFEHLREEYGGLITEMGLKINDTDILKIFSLLGGELFSEMGED